MADEEQERSDVLPAMVGAEFRRCPECDYENGFHNMFRETADSDVFDWYFVCPSCGSAFDVGLQVQRKERGGGMEL